MISNNVVSFPKKAPARETLHRQYRELLRERLDALKDVRDANIWLAEVDERIAQCCAEIAQMRRRQFQASGPVQGEFNFEQRG